MIALTLRNYLSRFGWEIAAFWVLSIGATFLLDRDGPPAALRAIAVLEIVALAWVTIRLVLAEDGFKTSGGWQTRPFSQKIRLGLPLALAVVVVVFPAIVRAFAFQRMFDGASIWSDFSPGSWWRQVGNWFWFFALPLKLFGLLILQRIEGRARTAAWATLALILLPLLSATTAKYGHQNGFGSGSNNPRELAQGIQHALPEATDLIGAWNEPIPKNTIDVPSARRIATFRIAPDVSLPGVSVRSAVATLRGSRVNVRIKALFDDNALVFQLEKAIAILHYADGTYATCPARTITRPGTTLPFFPADGWEFAGDFVSPLSLPEFEENPEVLTQGLELIFFSEDWDQPRLAVNPEAIQNPDESREFRTAPQSMSELFTQFPWPEKTWKDTALPYFNEHATREDIPFLLDRLREDTRLAEFFITRGWTAEAMPVLRELAKERIPMGPAAIIALAGEKDPALADDIRVLALDQKFGLNDLEPALRAQPGFDWPAFAKELWRRKKYATNWLLPGGEFWQPAFWAAQEGDFTGFRQTAEQAANGKKWESERLAELVAGEPEDVIGFVRENLQTLRYDAATRKWGL
ncbi:MAG: hypothetical protein V4640_07385 [Verrucomicrobiota bacterium]